MSIMRTFFIRLQRNFRSYRIDEVETWSSSIQKDFKADVFLIQQYKTSELSTLLRYSISCLKLEGCTSAAGSASGINNCDSSKRLILLQRALHMRKTALDGGAKAHMDTHFIVPTSKLVESFFSRAGYAFNNRGRALLPVNLEQQMFLYAKDSFWDVNDVSMVV